MKPEDHNMRKPAIGSRGIRHCPMANFTRLVRALLLDRIEHLAAISRGFGSWDHQVSEARQRRHEHQSHRDCTHHQRVSLSCINAFRQALHDPLIVHKYDAVHSIVQGRRIVGDQE